MLFFLLIEQLVIFTATLLKLNKHVHAVTSGTGRFVSDLATRSEGGGVSSHL